MFDGNDPAENQAGKSQITSFLKMKKKLPKCTFAASVSHWEYLDIETAENSLKFKVVSLSFCGKLIPPNNSHLITQFD